MTQYADLDSAKAQLSLDDDLDNEADIALLSAIASEVSRILELKTGRVWGGTATPTARTFDAGLDCSDPTLFLPEPARSISAVAIVGTNPQTLTLYDPTTKLGDYLPWHTTRTGDILAIRIVQNAYWPARTGYDRITVTAVWSNTAGGDATPQEIVDAATFATVETFRQRKSSPTGEIGPDGFTIRPRNPWAFTVVTEAVAKYMAAKPVVSF
jgi:hypothetical protein